MLESLALIGIAIAIVAVWAIVSYLNRISTGIAHLDANVQRLQLFLFVRLPQPPKDEAQHLAEAFNPGLVDLQAVSTGRCVTPVNAFPLRKLQDDCVRQAYRDAQEMVGAHAPFDDLPEEERDKIVDWFWFRFGTLFRDGLASHGYLGTPNSHVQNQEIRTGPAETRIGDVLIHEFTWFTPERTLTEPYAVFEITSAGREDRGSFFTRGRADARAMKLAGKHRRIVSERTDEDENESWWVDSTG